MARLFGVRLATALAVAPLAASAADSALGRSEFMANCAQCHGVGGKGDGIIAGYLTTAPSDLTGLAWGDRYSVEAAQAMGFTYTPAEQAAFIHRRIIALLDYLATIQEP